MSGRRGKALGYAGAGVVALGVSVWAFRRLAFGDVDPVGAAIALVSLLVGIASQAVAVRSWRLQQAATVALKAQLAEKVRKREKDARHQLLGDVGHPIDVQFDFRPAPTPAPNAEQASEQGRLSTVADYYRQLRSRRMVITGAAGAGKTVLAVQLMMMLLKNPEEPVPVRLSASSWDFSSDQLTDASAAKKLMERWLVAHLVEVYEFSPRSARALVNADCVLPVVDGLDELDATETPGYASRAGDALRVFNYLRCWDRMPLIVTCRSGHYQALAAELRVKDAAQVEIRPVDEAQASAFITACADDASRWQPVFDRIHDDPHGPLAISLSTPWRLTLAVAVYEQRDRLPTGPFRHDPRELTFPGLNTPEAVRDHLLDLFLPAALQRVPALVYDSARALRWLAVLAEYLDHNTTDCRRLGGRQLSGTDIVLHELWPLAGDRRPRLVALALLVPLWLALLFATPLLGWGETGWVGAAFVIFISSYPLWSLLWPRPYRLALDRPFAQDRRRELTPWIWSGLAIWFVVGLVIWFVAGPATELTTRLAAALAIGAAAGLVIVLRGVFAIGFTEPVDGATPGPQLITDDVLPVFSVGIARMRYIALLLCTRRWSGHWLPWRLRRFLGLCQQAGLVRIAGSGYQFRHRELQDHLARRPGG